MINDPWRERARNVLYFPYPPILRGYAPESAATPWFFSHGKGSWLFDENGNRYLDLAMGRGPNILGYGHEITANAIRSHAEHGIQTSLLHHTQVEVAELIVELVPCAEQVVFGKNGSDACSAAVRVARTATGCDMVLASGYHGFQDWYAVSIPNIKGFPEAYHSSIECFDLNDFKKLEDLCSKHEGNIACIMIEPAHRILPDNGFLEFAREMANKHHAVLIFDEVVTAFRASIGGAQERFGVKPDLACLGKAMTNGYPLSALVGRREIIEHLKYSFFSMTYQNDSLGFVLARDCIQYIRTNNIPDRINTMGEALRTAFNTAANAHSLPAKAVGLASRLDFLFPTIEKLTAVEQERIFLDTLVEHNMIPTLSAFVCEQFSDDDLRIASTIFETAMGAIAKSCKL
jgi:glutamate-1-semialdehyde 2,1-aminomutase/spore coat polysaccharide biosynthesis protein SpsF